MVGEGNEGGTFGAILRIRYFVAYDEKFVSLLTYSERQQRP